MAKAKGPLGVQNRHIYTRASYLYQAAAYLATASLQPRTVHDTPNSARAAANGSRPGHAAAAAAAAASSLPAQPASDETPHAPPKRGGSADDDDDNQQRALRNMSRSLLADMRAVTRKVLIRPRPAVKRTVCRYCDALLVEGRSCDAAVDNASGGGARPKPWADVLAVRCRACAGVKRFAVDERHSKDGRRRKLARAGRRRGGGSDEIDNDARNVIA